MSSQIFLFSLLLFFSAVTDAAPVIKRSIPSKAGYRLTWGDDFNTLSTTNWRIDTGTEYNSMTPQWGTGEIETYTTSSTNLRTNNGLLWITPAGSNGEGTSGRIETQRADFVCQSGKKMQIEAKIYLG